MTLKHCTVPIDADDFTQFPYIVPFAVLVQLTIQANKDIMIIFIFMFPLHE